MFKQPKEFRRIYMVSSAVFNAASYVFGWTAPLGVALGLAVDLTEDKKSNQQELEQAIKCAIDRTYNNIKSDTKRKILDELNQIEVEPDNLKELIKKTETYQSQYCTEVDAKEIVNIFETFFRDEISKNAYLSNLYVLSNGIVTIEKLKQINDIIVNNERTLNKIENEVSGITKMIKDAEKICVSCINSIAFIMISMAVFLGINVFSEYSYDKMIVLIVPICYATSDFLMFFLGKRQVFLGKRQDIFIPVLKMFSLIDEVFYRMIVKFIMPIILTTSCFWIIIFAIDVDDNTFLFSTVSLIIGKTVSLILKNLMFGDK